MRAFLPVALFITLSACVPDPDTANPLKPFTTDGCSMWIDGTPEQPNLWRHCCVAHDLAYWQGGSKTQRQQADADLLTCVEQAHSSGMANYIYANVRWGGSPYWITSYRWAYGWDYLDGVWPRGYKVPTTEEQAQINAQMPAAQEIIRRDTELYPANRDKDDTPALAN